MVSKNQLKLIKSLHQKKYRNQYGLFFVEGLKTVKELLASDFELEYVLVTKSMIANFEEAEVLSISEIDLKKISAFQSPSGVLAVFKIPQTKLPTNEDWILALDSIRDPGNLGTVIRLCDWFGVQNLVCSPTTVDCYNPKVLQATMGSITRVNIVYQDLMELITQSNLPTYGAFMDGNSIYEEKFSESGILIMGNEANGISSDLEKMMESKVSIPQFGISTTESLNVATATAILLNEIRRTW
ncbi:TrmH family RNA methyltransferase [Croceitalea rosinachiae]|uniref:RNA methyltransferase n=1 Tax=Croceitalea rosinachiae TaxID=3075596 RepID=A0ABU3A5I1_9FLAO|nr:RNA methyltransferase [Croceitalea sp. F388]MDT0605419.1 RNA methyltransferase [Croceitalea sp. F388]